MTFKPEHEIYKRRFSRNVGLGLTLAVFVGIVFGLTVVKVTRVGQMQGFDHVLRPEIEPLDASTRAAPAAAQGGAAQSGSADR